MFICSIKSDIFGSYYLRKKWLVVDSKKIYTIKSWPILKNIKQLGAFLGSTDYYRKFVYQYTTLVEHLTNLFSKDKFEWIDFA